MSENEYVMFNINFNCNCDMNGIYFLQYNGNEDAIKKFKKINKNNDAIKFYSGRFSEKDVMSLSEFKEMWDTKVNIVVQRGVLKGKFNVPGKNREYDKDELTKWWKKYLDDPQDPAWKNVVDEVIYFLNNKNNDEDEYIMFKISNNLDSELNGIYFVQYTDNESAIEKFKKINKGCGYTKFYNKKYTFNQVYNLLKLNDIWEQDNKYYHNIERLVFCGKFNVPGENKEHNKYDLVDWWIKYLGDVEEPRWCNIVEEIIDLRTKFLQK